MKIVLVNPIVRPESPPAYFPLGLAHIAGALCAEGHEVEIIDINAHRWSPGEVRARLRQVHFDWLGLTGLITEYSQVKWLAAAARAYHPGKRIVLGGGLATALPELILEDTAVDIVVIGEGEEAVVNLSRALEEEKPLEGVTGIAFHRNGKICFTERRPPIEGLGSVHPRVWGLFPVDAYAEGEKLGFEFPLRTLNVIAGRGCPYQCSYCFHGIFGHTYRARPARDVVCEMAFLKERYRLDGFLFSDDTFVLNRAWVEEFCELLRRHTQKITWACNARVDLVDKELLTLMKGSGCCRVFYGIESGSQKILDELHKNVTVEQAENAVRWSREAGIDVEGYFIAGAPGETRETMQETVRFCNQNRLHLAMSFATPLPGTEWFERALLQGKIESVRSLVNMWSRWNEDLRVNLSLVSDEELMALKNEAERTVKEAITGPSSVTGELRRMAGFLRSFGGRPFLFKMFCKVLRSTALATDPYTRSQRRARKSARSWADLLAQGT